MTKADEQREGRGNAADHYVRPWYRSRLFWLGLFPLIFMLWAWRDSEEYVTFLSIESKLMVVGLGTIQSNVCLEFFSIDHGGGKIFANRYPVTDDSGDPYKVLLGWGFPKAMEADLIGDDSYDVTYRWINIAWWFIASIYLTLWLTSLCWWQRRKGKRL